jgi:hypothetical protein
MALFHVATIVPTKQEMIGEWLPRQPWGPSAGHAVEVIGAYRFDDPEGRVGMETFIVSAGDDLFQVPFTYRDAPLAGADGALAGEMEHSALGTRWVYDGLHDPSYVTMLAAVAMTGQGEALGLVERDGRWIIAPTNVRISGGGWTLERAAVDGFAPPRDAAADESSTVLANDRFELTVHRRPRPGPRPPIGLTASWAGLSEPVVLAEVRDLRA